MLLAEGRDEGRGWVARRALIATLGPVVGMGGALMEADDMAAAVGCAVGEMDGTVVGGLAAAAAVALCVSLLAATVSGLGAMHIKHLSSPQLLR